ncbi:hypothetical protein SLS62_004905 [Diatrype stigma]|uniref:Siderophore iron transporter mirB n=1 Tax=Diatrype stigma TaxID=117547 RepID=A0AAN9UTZ7_9PEZI
MSDHITPTSATEAVEPPLKPEGEKMQDGVYVAEAVTRSWTKKSLIVIYICLTANLSPYITSDFEGHSLLTVIGTVTSIMSAACTMPVAKILNLWDRTVGFMLMLLLSLIGLIMMAACKNLATYCAAQVFYSVGSTGLIFAVDVLTSDTSSLQHRGLAFAFTSSPYIITAFAGSPLSEQFHESDWRWAYGTVTILLAVVTTPLIITWLLAKKKAEENKVLEKITPERTWVEGIKYYLIEFDVIGILLLIAGFCLLLLPLTLASSQADQWRTDYIIAMMVVGGVLVIAFALYERFFAWKPFIPWRLLTSRTVLGACLLDVTYQIAYYCWASYFTSYLQVVYDVSITEAGYIAAIFDLVSPVCLLFVGWLMAATKRFKWLLWWAVPLYMLAVGLMIYFRAPGRSVGFICLCEVLIGVGGGVMILVQQVAVLAASEHEDYAAMLALLSLFGNIGGAVGNSVSGAIWTNTLPRMLQQYLPADAVDQWADIYDSLDLQLGYPVGSAARDAIIQAYAMAQRNMLIAGTAIMALSLVWVFMIKNIRLVDPSLGGMLF